MSYSEKMLAALDEQNLQKADQLFKQALANDDPETLFNLAEELQALGFSAQSGQIAQQLLRQDPDADEARLMLAELAINDDQTDQALNWLSQIKPESPVYPQSLLTAADLYQTLNLLEVSEQKLLQAKVLLPDEPVVDFALGELYLTMGRYQEALAAYQRLADQKIDYLAQVSINQRRAEALAGLGEYEEAVELLTPLTESLATDDQLFQLGVLQHNLHRESAAIKTLTRLQQQNSDYSGLYEPLVASELANEQPEQALQSAQVGLGYDEFNLNLYRLGAEAALKTGATKKASDLLEKGLAIDNDAESLRALLGTIVLREGHYQRVVDLLAPLATADQADPQVAWELAVAYDHLDQVEAANSAYFQAYAELKDNPDFMRQFINFLQEEGQTAPLKLALQQYLRLVPDDPEYTQLLLDLESDQDSH